MLVQLREISILDTTFLEGLTSCSEVSDPKELVGKLLFIPKNFFKDECARLLECAHHHEGSAP